MLKINEACCCLCVWISFKQTEWMWRPSGSRSLWMTMFWFSFLTLFCTLPWRMFPLNVCNVDETKKNQATPEIHVLIKELSVWAAGLLALFHTETARSQRHWSGLSLCSWRFNSGFLTRCCSVCSHRTHFIISSSLIKSISLSCWYTCPHLWLITSSASFKWTHHSSTDNS